jgi:hypothetical protein
MFWMCTSVAARHCRTLPVLLMRGTSLLLVRAPPSLDCSTLSAKATSAVVAVAAAIVVAGALLTGNRLLRTLPLLPIAHATTFHSHRSPHNCHNTTNHHHSALPAAVSAVAVVIRDLHIRTITTHTHTHTHMPTPTLPTQPAFQQPASRPATAVSRECVGHRLISLPRHYCHSMYCSIAASAVAAHYF